MSTGLLRLIDAGAGKKFKCKPRRKIAPDKDTCRQLWFLADKGESPSQPDRVLTNFRIAFFVLASFKLSYKKCMDPMIIFSQGKGGQCPDFFFGGDGSLIAPQECLRLQGLPSKIHDAAQETGIKDTLLMGAAGTAWPVPVVSKMMRQISKAMAW